MDDNRLYRLVKAIDENEEMGTTPITALLWKLPLFDNPYLSMQAQNIMMVDIHLRYLETDLREKLLEEERTPMPDTMFVSALSQMWIFAVYEMLRTWRQMIRDLKNGKGRRKEAVASPSPSPVEEVNRLAEVYFQDQAHRFDSDPEYVASVDNASAIVEPVFKRIEALRMNLAKHEVPGRKGQKAIAPGYGRIHETDGSIYWLVDLGDVVVDGRKRRGQDMVSRRSIADELQVFTVGYHPPTEDFEDSGGQ